ncbi:MAG TPA: ABC transporter ATP-binding protein [Candidatus Blautia stercoravium]|nr:ABC transporter ATP-binding protein [Candidatus Blautia stercoravium]
MDVLTIQNLNKRFDSKKVLCGLELSVPEHSIFGFIGKNGAGKTTTMKAILGLIKSDSGEIYVMGEKVHFGQTGTNRYIGYLPDVPEFYSYMTTIEYLTLCGEICGMDKTDIVTRSKELLELVGLGQESHRIKGFSRGMKQRLGIAQALLNRPKLLICDEPTSALDPAGRKEILDILLAVKEQTTVLFSTHILSDVERICTEAAFLHDGKIAMQGTIAELRNKRSSDGFIIETGQKEATDTLIKAFRNLQRTEQNMLVFHGDENRFFDIMQYVAENRIPIHRIERIEHTLESLFLEVTK